MAVTPSQNPHPVMVRDYWPRFRKRAILMTILMQIAVTIVTGGALIATGVLSTTIEFWIILIAVLATTIGVNVVLFTQLMLPFKDLTSALTHVSGEPTTITPPNPNARHFERDGFKPILQLIYKLAVGDSGQKESTDKSGLPLDSITSALDNTAAGFIIMDAYRHIVYANPKAPVRTDTDGATVIDLLFEDDFNLDAWLKDCEQHAVHSEHTWKRVPNKITGEENRKIYDVTASYQKGSVAEVVISLFDRTADYQPDDDDLDFIAFAAHELRGPITVIRGYLDVFGDEVGPVLEEDQAELLKRLVVSSNRLSGYINNILNASRYDRRHLKVHLTEDTIANIYDTISDDMKLRATSQGRALSVHLPNDLPTIAADNASASEVLSNLIDNALKYSNEGGSVNVTAKVDGDFVVTSVEDHGIGMPGNVVSNLFHKFYRSHRSRETVSGTGIGLYISKAIVESHGGKISVRSVEGEGSTFTFSLPIYSTVADKLKANDNSNEGIINKEDGSWIKNHAMFRG
ncbi:MAG TPA: HAMP domain-containing sensor histidine kinase [Candidatus Saccharimonadales bacterium]|nr:HAMP domain-containing sensor histidine kinase [Candidatus Saccharimonadales bacterium]